MPVKIGLLAMVEAKPGKAAQLAAFEATADEVLAAAPLIRTIEMVAAKAFISG